MGIKILGLAALLAIGWTTQAWAGSLWRRDANLFSDHKARDVGDIVTIIISERATASHSISTEHGKEAMVEGGPKGGRLADNLLDFLPFFGAEGKTEYKGEGKTTRSGTLRAEITAQIVRVLPNGNLCMEGRKNLKIDGEEEEVVVTGIVRPEDIRPDNTVRSIHIANAQIRYRGGFRFSDRERPGLIHRLLSGVANFFF